MNRSFSAIAAATDFSLNLSGDVEAQRLRALAVTTGFFDALGVAPAQGRAFALEEEQSGRHRVAILSDGPWRTAFGARPNVVGTTVQLNVEPYTIVGVLPAGFWWTTLPDVIVPRAFEPAERTERAAHMFPVVARLRPGVSIAQARGDMDEIGRQLVARYPKENANHVPRVVPIREGSSATRGAPQGDRHPPDARRGAPGALVAQWLTESIVLGAIGGAMGVLLASWIVVVPAANERSIDVG